MKEEGKEYFYKIYKVKSITISKKKVVSKREKILQKLR